MFCKCPSTYGAEPNSLICPICLAMPGTKKQPQILLDMATSKIALGKTRLAFNNLMAISCAFSASNINNIGLINL